MLAKSVNVKQFDAAVHSKSPLLSLLFLSRAIISCTALASVSDGAPADSIWGWNGGCIANMYAGYSILGP